VVVSRRSLPGLATIVAVLLLPAPATAGTLTQDASAITYQAEASAGAGEGVGIKVDGGDAVIRSDRGFSTVPGNCTPDGDTRVCPFSPKLIFFGLGFDDAVSTDGPVPGLTIEAHGGAGGDSFDGTPGDDQLTGDEGDDSIGGNDGNDAIDGGPGGDSLSDGAGNDTVAGGAGGDFFRAGGGSDTYIGGDGDDDVSYEDRTAGVTVTLNAQPDDGEAGEGDNVDAEVVEGGSGPDHLTGNDVGNTLEGNDGDDTISAGGSEDRVDAGAGNDTLDVRDGGFDSVECGPGDDTVIADQDDSALSNCEHVSVPDADGDGFIADDCDNTNPAIHPGALEIIADGIDQDCDNRDAPRPAVSSPIALSVTPFTRKRPGRVASLRVTSLRRGDRVQVTCKGKGCAFKKKTRTARKGQSKMQLVKLFKKRRLRGGARVDVRVTREGYLGKRARFRISRRGRVKVSLGCLTFDTAKPTKCP
jgi:hypothetical protein